MKRSAHMCQIFFIPPKNRRDAQNKPMKTSVFDFHIPERLIAQTPSDKRSDSRLLVYYRRENKIIDSRVKFLPDFINDNYFLVFNNSRVIPLRIDIIKKGSGSPSQMLVLKIVDSKTVRAITEKSKKFKIGTEIIFPTGISGIIAEEIEDYIKIVKTNTDVFSNEYFEKYGYLPLPPYIKKNPTEYDKIRYQTIYGKIYGSAAAPTAGLHFDEELFAKLDDRRICYSFLSLHVGLGTFQPIYGDNIEDHKMHREEYYIAPEAAAQINDSIKNNKIIIPIGTTSLRTLETAYSNGEVKPGEGSSDIYIYPPYSFKVAGGLFTNFHTPKSSLAVLVSAMIGVKKLLEIYDYAVSKEYRFFSYGDAMLIL